MAGCVLVIDDDCAVLELLRDCLVDEGYEVHIHQDADQAEALIQSTRPDLLIIDHLFYRQDCLRVLAAVRGHFQTQSLPVIVCSAASDLLYVHREALANLGANVLPKPFLLEDLLALVHSLTRHGLGHAEPGHP